MSERSENFSNSCQTFQVDLSALVDRELEESVAGRVLLHLEHCTNCREFFGALRRQVSIHRELSEPGKISELLETMKASGFFPAADEKTSLRRLAAVLFQLGKAYTMLVLDKKYQFRLIQEPISIAYAKDQGKELVERVLLEEGSAELAQQYDWQKARELFGHWADSPSSSIGKAQSLLEESLSLKPNFAQAKLFLALVYRYQGRLEETYTLLHWVLRNAGKLNSRSTAAIQLGTLSAESDQFYKALSYSRWVLQRKLSSTRATERIQFSALYNSAFYYAQMGQHRRAVEYLSHLISRFPKAAAEVRQYIRGDQIFLNLVQENPGFARQLEGISPVFFRVAS